MTEHKTAQMIILYIQMIIVGYNVLYYWSIIAGVLVIDASFAV